MFPRSADTQPHIQTFTLPDNVARPIICLGDALGHSVCLAQGNTLSWLKFPQKKTASLSAEARISQVLQSQNFRPGLVVADLNPEYATAKIATRLSSSYGVPCVQVQHHQAHFLAVLLEQQLAQQATSLNGKTAVAGLIFDQGGYGLDGDRWGGEGFVLDKKGLRHSGQLLPVLQPGGNYALLEPYRMMLSHIWETFGNVKVDTFFQSSINKQVYQEVWRLIQQGQVSGRTSSMARLLDALAALLLEKYVCDQPNEAINALTKLAAEGAESVKPLPFELMEVGGRQIVDTRPLIGKIVERLARDWNKADLALACFKSIGRIAGELVDSLKTPPSAVVLSGDLFAHPLIKQFVVAEFTKRHLPLLLPEKIGYGDDNLALGQFGYIWQRRLDRG